jgi:hypothetical protein
MGKLRAFWKNVIDLLDDFLAYVLTIVGILLSNYIPLLKTTGIIDIKMDWFRIGISAIVAIMIIGKQESLELDETGSKEKSKAGRKKRFSIRMFNALAQGISWSTIMNIMTN